MTITNEQVHNRNGNKMSTPQNTERLFLHNQCGSTDLIQPKQLRRLHALWRRWAGKLRLSPATDQALRHYYVWLFAQGRADRTVELTVSDAEQVNQWLARLVRWADVRTAYAAGTAGRHGYGEWRLVPPNESSWSALWSCAAALGMERVDLENFIRRHYASAGLQSVADLRTMADLNCVLWGLKAILRRGARNTPSSHKLAAAA